MKEKKKINLSVLNEEEIVNNLSRIPRAFFDKFEYRLFTDDHLKENYRKELRSFFSNSRNFTVSVVENGLLKGYLLVDFMEYDSQIFEFNVYRIRNFVFLGKDDEENELIISTLLLELDKKIKLMNIKYITLSLNANNSLSNLFFNTLLKKGFYYIHTLLSFKMNKAEFGGLRLAKPKKSGIIIRHAEKKDSDSLIDIAGKSYKINRFHMDRNLANDKCDLQYAKSAENSILNGFADVIFVAEYNNNVVGYYSGKKSVNNQLNVSVGNAIVSAVSEKARGLGVFSLLNNNLLEWFNKNSDISEMGTYITNIPVHKTWTNNGLNIVRGSYQLAKYIR
jgi:hypothetical protein